jgi:hypothetical protein
MRNVILVMEGSLENAMIIALLKDGVEVPRGIHSMEIIAKTVPPLVGELITCCS